MADLIPAMEKALIDFSTGKVTQPVRSVIKVDVAAATGFLGLMPALTPDGLGLKAVTFYPSNVVRGIPTHMATIFLIDPQTGTPLAIMDGRLITEMRTAAVSAAATKLLASPDATVLAILGSGVQARSHVEALWLVRPFEEIRVWSPDARECTAARKPNRCDSNVRRRSGARRGCDRDRHQFENARVERKLAETRFACKRDRCVPAGLAGTRRRSDEQRCIRRFA